MDDADYEEFLRRLDRLVPELGFTCFAWALMPNHVHLALRTGPVPTARLMARLLTGYASYFNRRHERVGHLLQYRYRSRWIEDIRDLLAVILYVHRNPLEAGLATLGELTRFPWCGHAALVGARSARPFESVAEALEVFGDDPLQARAALSRWMALPGETMPEPEPPSWEPLHPQRPPSYVASPSTHEGLVAAVCAASQVGVEALTNGSRVPKVARAREIVAVRAARELGMPGAEIARRLGVSRSAVSRMLARAWARRS